MKVTVCIDDTKIVVPCGGGDFSIRQLAELAIIRYRKTVLSKGPSSGNIEINSLKLSPDGGELDWDDKVHDVLDDKDILIAQYSIGASDQGHWLSDPVSSPPLNHHKTIVPGDIITTDRRTLQEINQNHAIVPVVSSANPDHYNNRHNSIPCSEHDVHRYFDLFDAGPDTRHESLDNIFDLNYQNRRIHNHNSLSTDYEKWPLPPFPALSIMQSSIETTVLPKNVDFQLNDTDGDDLTWDNSTNECYEEDYPRLRPDYIVKHLERNHEDKCLDNSVPSRQVIQWLKSQESASGSGSSAGGVSIGGSGGSGAVAGGDLINVAALVLDERNNNRNISTAPGPGNEHNRSREETSSSDRFCQSAQCPDNSIGVRLTNIKPGENLGIKIMPAYIQDSHRSTNNAGDNDPKFIFGIDVFSIVPRGRVAKERQLNKGDKIIQINDISLHGMLFESAESIFREALQKPECRLRVIPHQYPTVQLIKANPPPPPRRSPNTSLSSTKTNPSTSDIDTCRSYIPLPLINAKTTSSKLNPTPLPPPIHQKPVASWTSGLGSMLHTPASSTSSVSAIEKKKVDQITNGTETIKTELIELTKIGSGFGFSITGMENLLPSIPTAVYVKHILYDGAAIRDGRLKSDDRLLEIDGLLLDGMSQNEVIALLREKPSGSRVKLLVERNEMKKSSPMMASHDSLMTSLSEMDEDGSTLSKNKRNVVRLHFDIPLKDITSPNGRTTLGVSVKVEPNWDKANITPFSSKEDIAASNIMWVKTVIEDGAAYRHGKIMVGDQVLEVNGVQMCGLSSDDALMKLKSLIKESQNSDEGIIRLVILRKANIARSSSLNTLNSMTCSSSAISYRPIFDQRRNMSYKIPNNQKPSNIPSFVGHYDEKESKMVPKRSIPDVTKLPIRTPKRSAPLPPTPDFDIPDCYTTDKSTKTKPAPPPPPLARRLKNIEASLDMGQFVPPTTESTSEATSAVDHRHASYSTNLISKSPYQSDEFLPKNIDGFQCSSTTNTLCRNKETRQLLIRARNTRSNCSYTPTKEILHIDDIDWDKMELIPFDNCQLNSKSIGPIPTASSSQPVISRDIHTKRIHDTGVQKRKAFKKFSIGQIFRFKHSHYSKPSNSVGSSPVNTRKHIEIGTAIPTSSSSFSLKSSDPLDEKEFPYAELDFNNSPIVTVPETTSVLLKSINNLNIANNNSNNVTAKNALLPLPEEEAFKCLHATSSEDSDSYDDFVDMQTTFPEHISAAQRIAAAMPKQPPNRFVYEDAEELFQSLQANVSLYNNVGLSPSNNGNLSSATNNKPSQTSSNEIYQNILAQYWPDKHQNQSIPSSDCLNSTTNKDLYCNWPILRK